ncbi:hypothetical protein Btru_063300 [Bulinus truncatus]|nr:hypothetical protein Btru_063300 [Bulinus truncatus]
MSSLNESRSSDNIRRPRFIANNLSNADNSFQGNLTVNGVRSSPAAAVPVPRNQRPNFFSADHVYRPQNFETTESSRPAMNDQRNRAGGSENASGGQQGGMSVYVSQSFRQTIQESENIVDAVAMIEKRKKPPEEEDLYQLNDSSVDDAKTFPVLPPISRRNSDRLERNVHQGLTIRSLPDLRRIKSTFTAIAAWEGITDPDVIVEILENHPIIDVIYMSPVLPPSAADYSPYFMHMVSPGSVDVLNYCAVGRQFVIRYVKGLTYTLSEFMEDQEHFTREVTSKIERYTTMLLHLTSRTCWDDVINAGLAVEREERKHLAPKRINELRKMQRRKLNTSEDTQRLFSDESSIGQWIHVEGSQAKQFEQMKEDRCVRLSHFVYQIDCMLRQALYQIYLNSLGKTADYLSLQMKTFPTDAEIKALVRGYVGNLDIQQSSLVGDDDDDDDNDDGDHKCGNKREEGKGVAPEDKKDSEGFENDQKSALVSQSAVSGKDSNEQPAPHRSQATMENEISVATTTTGATFLSSSAPTNLTSDSQAFATNSSTADNALYTRFVHGELGLIDSLDSTTSSSLSDEVDVNTMGNEDRFLQFNNLDLSSQPGRLDDLNALVVVGTVMRPAQNGNLYQQLTNENVHSATEGFVSENEVTVVENANRLMETDSISDFAFSPPKSDRSLDVISPDLTITSEERDAHSKEENGASSLDAYFVSHITAPNLKNLRLLPSSPAKDMFEQLALTTKLSQKAKPDKKKNSHLSLNSTKLIPSSLPSLKKEGVQPALKISDRTLSKCGHTVSDSPERTCNLQDSVGIHHPRVTESNIMGQFGHLFIQAGESSVDITEDSFVEEILEFPILDGTTWEPENVDHYLSVRSYRSSSVDEANQSLVNSETREGSTEAQNALTIRSETSDSTKTSFRSAMDNCRNITQNKMNCSSDIDLENIREENKTLLSPKSSSTDSSVVINRFSPSTSMTSLVPTGQINILEFLSKELDYPYAGGMVSNKAKINRQNLSAFTEEIIDESEDGQLTRVKPQPLTGQDGYFSYNPGVRGMRKDGGRHIKKSKVKFIDDAGLRPRKADEQALENLGGTSVDNVEYETGQHENEPLSDRKTCAVSIRRSLSSPTLSHSSVVAEFLHNVSSDKFYDPLDMQKEKKGKKASSRKLKISCNKDITDCSVSNVENYFIDEDEIKKPIVPMARSKALDKNVASHIFESVTASDSADELEDGMAKMDYPTTEEPMDNNNGNIGRKDSVEPGNSRKAGVAGTRGFGGGGVTGPHVPSYLESKNSGAQELKPMFHAAVHLNNKVVGMTPDVYDFTGTAFNMIHDMEEHLLSIDTLTSNHAFLPFVMPLVQPGTPVDKIPKGPSLEMVLRRDHHLVQVKNTIYGCIDAMFHSAGVYTAAIQKLFIKYFLPQILVSGEIGAKETIYFLKSLQLLDTQLKLIERVPESQRLGMFLFDVTPCKESLRVILTARQQSVQEEINQEAILRIHSLIRKLDNLLALLESHPTTLDALYVRLTTTDSLPDIITLLQSREISQIASLYDIMDRFAVPHNEDERRVFESCHYMLSSIQRAGQNSKKERKLMIEGIDKCLDRDVSWIQSQVKKVLKPITENSLFLDGFANVMQVKQALTYAEEMVRSYVAKANFVREIQRYLGRPESHFRELFQVSSRYVNTRNLWLLMADWDTKLNNWKRQSFVTLDIQKINNYTFKYMEACNKLEKVLPKNTVVSVFGEKMDIMLRWLNFIIEFRGQAIKPRHWRQIEEVLGVEFGEQLPLTLASLMSINAIERQKNLHVILNKARAEMNVQSEYDEVYHQCQELKLTTQVKQKTLLDGEEPVNVCLLGDTFELRRLLLRHGELSQILPAEVKSYKEIFMEYSGFMERVQSDPSALKWCSSQEMHDLIESLHSEIISLYRIFKRDIEQRVGVDAVGRDQPIFGL